jgi:ABC-type multidrug transport system ATPase subunit
MEITELRRIRRKLTGIPNESGLSVEQRKRLSIAVELVANPRWSFWV